MIAAFTDATAFFIVVVAFVAAAFASAADAFDASAQVRELCVLPVAESESDTPSGDDVDTAHDLALVSDAFAFVSLDAAAWALFVATVALSAVDFWSASIVLR